MTVGPHVFGDNRLGLWIINNSNLTDKLKHVLPRIKASLPVTDIFLPEQANSTHKNQCKENGFFTSMYAIPSGRGPVEFADKAIAAYAGMGAGALELNVELPDGELRSYISSVRARIRSKKPFLPLRINIATFKGAFMPATLFVSDPNLFLIEGAYFGNMDGRASEADVLMDMIFNGIPLEKASVMYGVLNGNPRVNSLPAVNIRALQRGSILSDDLMMEAGLL